METGYEATIWLQWGGITFPPKRRKKFVLSPVQYGILCELYSGSN